MEPRYVHVYPRTSEGYLDFAQTLCGLCADDAYVIDPTAAGLKFWVAGLDNACVCIDCLPRKKRAVLDIHTEMSLYSTEEESESEGAAEEVLETLEQPETDNDSLEQPEDLGDTFEQPEFQAESVPEDDLSEFMSALG